MQHEVLNHITNAEVPMIGIGPGSPSMDGDGSQGVKQSLAARTTTVAATAAAIVKGKDGGRKLQDRQSLEYALRTGIAGGLAGCAAKTVVGPLDRVKILFQASSPQFAKYSGSWTGLVIALRQIGRTEGTRGLFRGHSATLLRVFPYAGIKFLAYEQFRGVLIPTKQQETPVRRLLSGSLAGLVSVFCTYPLEMIRVRLAFETKRDSRSSLLRICSQIYNEHPSQTLGEQRSAVGATIPQNVAVTRGSTASTVVNGAVSSLKSTSHTVDAVTPQTGIANFYRGFLPTLLGILPYAGVSFLTHDYMGDILRLHAIAPYTVVSDTVDRAGRARLTNTAELFSGAIAGLVGQTTAYPLEIIRRRMQVGGAIGDGHRLRIAETAAKVWLERGWRGFFVGLGIGYFKVLPMSAVSFWTYEKCKHLLGV